MKFSVAILTAFAAAALAIPTTPTRSTDGIIPFGPGNPVVNATCPKLPIPSHTKRPLKKGFPIANQLGSIISPVLNRTLGPDTVEDIDKIADQLCVSAEQSGEGNGICQDTFAAARAFVDAKTPLNKGDQFGCLLNLLCIANNGPKDKGTCNFLLGGADCIANRIVGVDGVECKK